MCACVRQPRPVKLFCGIIAAGGDALLKAEKRLRDAFGEIDARSEVFPFDQTDYYRDEMGAGLQRMFVSFSALADPGDLAGVKRRTNALESELAVMRGGKPCRRANLDPGYLDGARLVLATAKDFAHRVYLRDGIYAEVTLIFRKGRCVAFEWTFPDFKSGRYDAFFLACREQYLMALKSNSALA